MPYEARHRGSALGREFDPLDGVILHELKHDGTLDKTGDAHLSPARQNSPVQFTAE